MLFRSRPEIEHGSALVELQLFREPRDGVSGIFGPRALVEVGNELERAGVGVLKLRHVTRGTGR